MSKHKSKESKKRRNQFPSPEEVGKVKESSKKAKKVRLSKNNKDHDLAEPTRKSMLIILLPTHSLIFARRPSHCNRFVVTTSFAAPPWRCYTDCSDNTEKGATEAPTTQSEFCSKTKVVERKSMFPSFYKMILINTELVLEYCRKPAAIDVDNDRISPVPMSSTKWDNQKAIDVDNSDAAIDEEADNEQPEEPWETDLTNLSTQKAKEALDGEVAILFQC